MLVALRLPGVDVAELVQVHRRHLVETMRYYTRLKEDAGEDDIGLLLVADAELFRLDAVVRWLDAADAPAQATAARRCRRSRRLQRRRESRRRVGARR